MHIYNLRQILTYPKDGPWVRHEGHLAEVSRLQAELERAQERIQELEWRLEESEHRPRAHAPGYEVAR